MSTIRVDNFGPSAGGTTYSARGIAKAWVNFDGTGTIAVRDSENVSSLTDNGTGDYTVSFTGNFNAADYCYSYMPRANGSDGLASASSIATGSITVNSYTSNGNAIDRDIQGGAVFGDLA